MFSVKKHISVVSFKSVAEKNLTDDLTMYITHDTRALYKHKKIFCACGRYIRNFWRIKPGKQETVLRTYWQSARCDKVP